MDDRVPFLMYSRKKLGSAAGKSNDSESKDPKNEAATEASKGKRTELTGKPKIEGDLETPLKKKRGADVEITLACLSSTEKNTSRLRPRKEVPSFRTIDLCNNDNRRIIGKRVKVYWSGSRRWFIGRVKAFHHRKRLHTILYEDGDMEELDLRKELFELEILPTENFHLSSEPNCRKKLIKAVKGDDELNEDVIRSDSESHLEKDTEADVIVTDEASDAEGTGRSDSCKISEVENKTTKTFGAQVTELVPCSKVKDTVSCGNIEDEDVLEDFSKEEKDGEPLNRRVRLKKNTALRDSKIRSSKSHCNEESKEMKRADLDQDVHYNFVDTNVGQCDFNIDDQEKSDMKTESMARKSAQNHDISYETQLSNSDSDGTKEEERFYDVKVKWETGEHVGKKADDLMSVNRKKDDVFPFVRSVSRGVNVRKPRTMKTYVDMESFSKAGERKSGEKLFKEKELGSKRGGEVRKSESIGSAERQKNPIRRKRSAVITK